MRTVYKTEEGTYYTTPDGDIPTINEIINYEKASKR